MRWKRPFATKPSLAQLNLTFFTDRDLGKAVPRLLRESGLVVEEYFDHFDEKARVPDNEWLRYAALRRWISLSHDKNIRYDREAIRTVMESSGRLFILRGKVPSRELAPIFVQAESSVVKILGEGHRAFISSVHRTAHKGGIVKASARTMLTYEDWLADRAPVDDG